MAVFSILLNTLPCTRKPVCLSLCLSFSLSLSLSLSLSHSLSVFIIKSDLLPPIPYLLSWLSPTSSWLCRHNLTVPIHLHLPTPRSACTQPTHFVTRMHRRTHADTHSPVRTHTHKHTHTHTRTPTGTHSHILTHTHKHTHKHTHTHAHTHTKTDTHK